jgi:hypothetical protein
VTGTFYVERAATPNALHITDLQRCNRMWEVNA